jgi:lysozyme
MANYKYSSAGLDLTEQFEGCRLTAYQDQVGVWTIGYGHTGADVKQGLTITQDQASILLASDLAWAVTCVNKSVTAAISQNQFDALVDFVFNLGCANFCQSTLLRKVNGGQFADAAKEFMRWNRAGGKVVAGLTRRRQAEADLFSGTMSPAPVSIQAAAVAGPKKVASKKHAAKKAAKAADRRKAA